MGLARVTQPTCRNGRHALLLGSVRLRKKRLAGRVKEARRGTALARWLQVSVISMSESHVCACTSSPITMLTWRMGWQFWSSVLHTAYCTLRTAECAWLGRD